MQSERKKNWVEGLYREQYRAGTVSTRFEEAFKIEKVF